MANSERRHSHPHAGRDARAELDKLRGYAKALDPPATDGDKEYVPPISMMAIVGYTHTQGPTVAPPTDPYKANDNVVLIAVQRVLGRRDHRQYRRVRAGHL